jgi:probable HAF family extracellular repeat protein
MSMKIMFACLSGMCAAQIATAAPTYTYTAIGDKYTSAIALNQLGDVAVNTHAPEVPHRGSIEGPSGSIAVGTLDGMDSEIYGINNRGEAVGISGSRGFLYTGGQIREFTASRELGFPSFINDRGDIAGTGFDRPFFYRKGELELFATSNSQVTDMNEAGVVVGILNTPGRPQRPFMYSEGRLTELGTLGGETGVPVAINELGAVLGYASKPGEQPGVFLYENGVMRELEGFPAGSIPADINNHGQIVGYGPGERGFLYSEGVMTDLNALLLPADRNFVLVGASDINDRQQILATGCFTGQDAPSGCFGALLSPIPEASSWLMLLSGAVLIGVRRARRAPWA